MTNIDILKYSDLSKHIDYNFEYEAELVKRLIEEWDMTDLFARFCDPCSKIPVNQIRLLDHDNVNG